jgi:TRAP-type C4-dicarboxylate transport system substrate-binding protein
MSEPMQAEIQEIADRTEAALIKSHSWDGMSQQDLDKLKEHAKKLALFVAEAIVQQREKEALRKLKEEHFRSALGIRLKTPAWIANPDQRSNAI